MNTQTTKVKNGTITLPKEFRKSWKGADVFLFSSADTLIVKKVQKPLEAEWKEYEKKLNRGRKKISSKVIRQAVQWSRTKF